MGSLFGNTFAAFAADGLMDQFSDPTRVTYTTGAGGSSSVFAIVGAETARQEDTINGVTKFRLLPIKIRTDPTTPKWRGVANPKLNDTVTIDGVEWAVHELTSTTESFHDLMLTRPEQMNATRPSR